MRAWRNRRLAAARKMLGGECVVCGSSKRLEFDHIDPKSKIDSVTTLSQSSKKTFDAEVAKCQLLCWQHHIAKSILERGHVPAAHGRLNMYQYHGCRCDLCKNANNQEYARRRIIADPNWIKSTRRLAEHGTCSKYSAGCRCVDCCAAQTNYHRAYRATRRSLGLRVN